MKTDKDAKVKKEKLKKESVEFISKNEYLLESENNVMSDLQARLENAQSRLEETGEKRFHNMVVGLSYKIEKENDIIARLNEMIVLEATNMEDEIKPIVSSLEGKGYMVKYASPGHHKLRKKEDQEPDGVYHGHLYSDARIMFDKDYGFTNAPKYWHWRIVDGCSYLDITPLPYNEKDGTPDEAFSKWKTNYMNSLKKFVDDMGTTKTESVKDNEMVESVDTYEIGTNIMESLGVDIWD